MSSLMRKRFTWAKVVEMASSGRPFYIHAVTDSDARSFDPATGTLTPQGTTNPGTLGNGKIYFLRVSSSEDLNRATKLYPASKYVIAPDTSPTYYEIKWWNGDYVQSTGSITPSPLDGYVYFSDRKEGEVK
ncbi:hypothetical protein [Burkholderia sola]